MKLFKLPPKSEKKDYKFSPAKLVISCVLIAALLISMSIGLSYARYRMKSVPTETTVLSANGIQADGTHTLVFPKAASGDTVMEMFDGNVKITIPSTAKLTSSGVDLTDYIEYFVVDFPSNLPSYTYNYTLTSNQITVDLNVRVRALGRFGMGNLTDTTASEKVEIRVGKDYLGNANTSSGPAYDGSEWITYGNLNRINRSFNTKYDKKDWAEYADTDWYNTTDTSFTISTGAELAGLAAIVNGTADGIDQDSFAGKTITLGDDISLYSGEDRLDGNGEEKRIWIPIGTKTNPFSGTFDGNGNTISGLNICNPRSTSYNTSDQDNSVGLFGYVSGSGSISDVTLDDINIGANIGTPPSTSRQGQSMGALVGRIDDSAAVEISDVSAVSSAEEPSAALSPIVPLRAQCLNRITAVRSAVLSVSTTATALISTSRTAMYPLTSAAPTALRQVSRHSRTAARWVWRTATSPVPSAAIRMTVRVLRT